MTGREEAGQPVSTVTWKDITAITRARGGTPARSSGSGMRAWRIPSPAGGTLHVEVMLRPRWCSIVVDRMRTVSRDPARSAAWFAQHVDPHVERALAARQRGPGWTPAEGGDRASAYPLDRAGIPRLLAAWLDAELSWGIPAGEQRPRSASHLVTPGTEGNYK